MLARLCPPSARRGAMTGHRLNGRSRLAHNSVVGRSHVAPATKYGRFSLLLAYAQAADQHVWSAASVFMGTVCVDLLSPCVCSIGRVGPARAARTLRFRDGDADQAKNCVRMHRACLRSCPTQSASGFGRGDIDFDPRSARGADLGGCHLSLLADRLMDRADRTRTFAHGGCDPLHRAVPHIASGEESWHAGLEGQRMTAEQPERVARL